MKYEVRDVAWGGIYELLDAVSRGAALQTSVRCLFPGRKVILNVL